MELILASASPRRRQILSEHGFQFEIITADFEELLFGATPSATVKAFALGKAKAVFDSLPSKRQNTAVVLSADTVVSFDGKILGKPANADEATKMLKMLSGNTHTVYTGYAIVTKKHTICQSVATHVTFNSLTDEQIANYVATGKPLDKAGAYGIQDGYNLVEKYDGSFLNIVGLPIESFAEKLKTLLTKHN